MSSLAAEDIETLKSIGTDTIRSIVAISVEAVLWTVYMVLIVVAGNILLRKRRSTMSFITLGVVVTMFLMDTAIFFIDVNNAVKEISWTLTSNLDMSLPDRYELTFALPWPVESALYAFMSNLGDVIVIWRVYAFYSQGKEPWLLLIPTALLGGSFITSGLISFCVAKLVEDPAAGDFENPPFCKHVQLSSYCTTMATTGVATFMISYKTWQYRKNIGRHLRQSNNKSKVERVMYILVESGIFYFLFFLEAVITDTGNVHALESSTPQLAFASTVWTYMTSHIMGIYPVLIVILVHLERSYIEPTGTFTTGHFNQPTDFTGGSMQSRRPWGTSQTVATAQRTHPIEISVHELHSLHGDTQKTMLDDDLPAHKV